MLTNFRKLSVAIKDQKVEEALDIYFKLIKEGVNHRDIIFNIVKDTIPILYRTKYFHVPHGLMGIMASIDIANHLNEYKHLPLAQAINYITNENKLAPLNFSVYTPLYLDSENDLKTIEEFITDGEVAKTYRYFLGLISNQSICDKFHHEMFKIAMKDTVNIGHKAIYYHKILELNSYFNLIPPNIYYPSISYLASEPKDYSLYEVAQKEYNEFLSMNIDVNNNTNEMSKEESSTFIDIIINSMKSRVLTSITKSLKNGMSVKTISDNLAVAASQLILDTDTTDWIKPIHGFNYCYALNWWIRNSHCEDKALALYLQAAIINKFSIEHKKVHFMASSVFVKSQKIIDNIARSIQVNNVSDAVALTQSYVLSQFDIDILIDTFAFLSVQNDSLKNFTHNMKFTSSCIHEYKLNTSPNKWLILVALAKQLSQSTKEYKCFKMYEEAFFAEADLEC